MTNIKDLSGKCFNRLTVIEMVERSQTKRVSWKCRCVCGNEVVVDASHLKSGNTKSCGCLHKDSTTTHGLTKHPLYMVYADMKKRCLNPEFKTYHNYGGRGITVCDRWLKSIENFIEDVSEGYQKGLELDRINNDGNYEPDNVRWVTRQQNSMNKRGRKNSSSKYKGVSFNKKKGKWISVIVKDGKHKYLGEFVNEDDAARAYNKAALEMFGDSAYFNTIK